MSKGVKTILNVVGGVEIECYDETVGQNARVVIRNSRGGKVAVLIATATSGRIYFNQQSSESSSESHAFVSLPDQQFCGAKLSDSFMCCLPPNHRIHGITVSTTAGTGG